MQNSTSVWLRITIRDIVFYCIRPWPFDGLGSSAYVLQLRGRSSGQVNYQYNYHANSETKISLVVIEYLSLCCIYVEYENNRFFSNYDVYPNFSFGFSR